MSFELVLLFLFSVCVAGFVGYFLGSGQPRRKKPTRVIIDYNAETVPESEKSAFVEEEESNEESKYPEKATEVQVPGRRQRIVVISYTLPVKITREDDGSWKIEWKDIRTPHANVKVMEEAFHITWVGACDIDVPRNERDDLEEELENFNCIPVFLERTQREMFFNQFCKGVLWPLFHYVMPTNDPYFGKRWEDAWQAFTNVNILYARKAVLAAETDDVYFWFNNYHLLCAPSFVRKKLPHAKIGLFLHTTFPTCDVFRSLPGREAILRGILSADLVGFHTYDYGRHFLSSCKRILGLDFKTMKGGLLGVNYCGRDVSIRISHIGIRADYFNKTCMKLEQANKIQTLREKYNNRRIIIGVDELDVVKGTLLKIQAFGRFLATHREYRDQVVLIEVLLPCLNVSHSSSEQLRERLLEEVKSIHDTYSPEVLEIIETDEADIEQLVALYAAADVGLFSSFWDGLNTIPYEFTASQLSSDPGALIVSEFMGCSRSLSGVQRVNPWRLEDVSEALNTALTQSKEVRTHNHTRRFEYVMNYSFSLWAQGFLHDLEVAAKPSADLSFVQVGWGSNVRLIGLKSEFKHLDEDLFTKTYCQCKKRLLLFDYGGTLTAENHKNLKPSKQILVYLQILASDPNSLVFILSGNTRQFLDKNLAEIKNIGLAAEKGAFFKWPGSTKWEQHNSLGDVSWKSLVYEILKSYTDRTGGAYIQVKETSLIWHYERADIEYGNLQAKEIVKYVEKVMEGCQASCDVMLYDHSRVLEVKPEGISKYGSTKDIMMYMKDKFKEDGSPFVLCIGNDRSDEKMFQAVSQFSEDPSTTFTCTIGIKPSFAKYYVHESSEVVDILAALSVCANKLKNKQ